jgi:hypothetical protein
MKHPWLLACLFFCVALSSTARAQLAGRCSGDDNLTPQQVQGRNAWARKCNYLSATKEAILNADAEYQVFANGCFQHPCSTANCQFFVPISASAPCVSGLILLGSCVASVASPVQRYMLAAGPAEEEEPWRRVWHPKASAQAPSRGQERAT